MKKLFVAAVALFFTACMAQAQDNQAQVAQPALTDVAVQPEPSKFDMKNCFMMKADKLVWVKGGKVMPMEADMKTSNGITVSKDGSLIGKDGKKMMLKNGEYMDMDGNVSKIERQTRSVPAKDKDAK